jgi:hypothetical protein
MLPDGSLRGCTLEQLLASAFGNGDDGVGSLFEGVLSTPKSWAINIYARGQGSDLY